MSILTAVLVALGLLVLSIIIQDLFFPLADHRPCLDPACDGLRLAVVYRWLPGHYCPACGLFTGPAAWYSGLVGFDGNLLVYEGSYIVALSVFRKLRKTTPKE